MEDLMDQTFQNHGQGPARPLRKTVTDTGADTTKPKQLV